MTQTLTINDALPSWNELWKGVHWSKRKRITDAWHNMVFFGVKEAKLKPMKRVRITFIRIAPRVIDSDNIIAKPCLDALVLSGILVNDTPEYVTEVTLRSEKGKKKQTIIILEDS